MCCYLLSCVCLEKQELNMINRSYKTNVIRAWLLWKVLSWKDYEFVLWYFDKRQLNYDLVGRMIMLQRYMKTVMIWLMAFAKRIWVLILLERELLIDVKQWALILIEGSVFQDGMNWNRACLCGCIDCYR